MGMMNMMMGAAGGVIVNPLPGGTSHGISEFGAITVALTFGNDGSVVATATGVDYWSQGPVNHRWFTSFPSSTYYVRATVTFGSVSGGTTGTWLSTDVNRSWSRNRSTVGTSSATLLIEIAADSNGSNIITSGSYTISATTQNP
jgi:hypothetical protein